MASTLVTALVVASALAVLPALAAALGRLLAPLLLGHRLLAPLLLRSLVRKPERMLGSLKQVKIDLDCSNVYVKA